MKRIFVLLLAGLLASPSAHAQFSLIHAFEGAPGDGSHPGWDSSLVASGSTLYGMTETGGANSNGILFKVNVNGSGFQMLHSFNGYSSAYNPSGSIQDGATPYGTPVISGSKLFGTTYRGGSNGVGTVWRMNLDGSSFQVLHHFGEGNDGSQPISSLALSGTTLFGVTSDGGSNFGNGTVFRIETDGTGYQVLHQFNAANNGAITPYGTPLVLGNMLYGTTTLGGGVNNKGVIYAMGTDGNSYQVIHTFLGANTDGAEPYGALIADGSNLYGTTQKGGANDAGTLFKIGSDGSGFEIRHSFGSSEAFWPYGSLLLDGSTLYAFTYGGVTNNGAGSGNIIRIQTDGSDYQRLYTFNLPFAISDGAYPFGTPIKIGTKLYGMTSFGGTPSIKGTVFSFDLSGGGGGGGGGAASLTGTLSKVKEKCKLKNDVTTCKLGASLALLNTGDALAPATHVRFFLSTDAAYNAGADTLLGEATTKTIKPGKSGKAKLKAATNATSANQYILAVDDSDAVLASYPIPVQ